MHIRAGNVDLQPAHLLLRVQAFAGIGVILHAEAADVCHHRLMEYFLQLRQFLRDHLFHPGILQAHGVDHARRAFRDTGRGISETGIFCGSLEGEGSQAIDIVPLGKLIPEAESTAGGDHRVVQFQTTQVHN